MDFFSKYKRILMVIVFIFIVFILGFLIYSMFFKPMTSQVETKPDTNATSTTTGLPKSNTGQGQITAPADSGQLPGEVTEPTETTGTQPTQQYNPQLYKTDELTKTPALGATLSTNGSDLQYYDSQTGKFYKIDKNGEMTPLSDKVFHSVSKITWSSGKNRAILEYPDGANILYDFDTEKQVTLPQHWKDFDFEPGGNNFVMKSIGLDQANRWLAIANVDGSGYKPIEALGDKDSTVIPLWSPNKQSIAVFSEGIDFDRQDVFFVGLNKENFKSTVVEGRGFQPKWAPEGKQLLYSVYSSSNDLKPNLWIVDALGDNIGNNRRNLNIETWANKCTFANNDELYCAVPENLEAGSGLMPELAKNTKDNLYKINLINGTKKLIAIPDGNYNISNLIISENQNYIYFNDETTLKLHKIKL
jgi:hypothetical protein